MDKIIDFLPAILILVSVMTITIIVLIRYGGKIFDKNYKTSNVLLLIAAFLFITILIVHLFREQTWTADSLKIIIGILVGAGSSKLNSSLDKTQNSINMKGSNVEGDVAGRDINKTIQNIEDAITEIKDSVVHQNNQISRTLGDTNRKDYLINTIYERGNERMFSTLQKVIQKRQSEGWALSDFSSDYHGMDGIFLIFSRSVQGKNPEVFFHHGSDFN